MSGSTLLRGGAAVGVLITLLALVPDAAAQAPPGPSDAGRSSPLPEVLADRRVIFRIKASRASEVTLRGDWINPPAPVRLERGEAGDWSVTVGPLEPDLYSYSFTVDGLKTPDPRNASINPRSLDNLFFLPGDAAAFEDVRDVPHGQVRTVWYRSSTLGIQRRMHVYTPPGYDDSTSDRYPALYLLHGNGDDDSAWSFVGRAGFILDNLLAEKKARPMLLVMPDGGIPGPSNATAPPLGGPEWFTSELLKGVVPFVEQSYRVQTGAQHRALAGLSMGAGQALRAAMGRPDQFAYVGVWSAGLGTDKPDFERRNAAFLQRGAALRENAQKFNGTVKLFWIGVADKDPAAGGSKSLSEFLTQSGINNELHVTPGGHTWITWRHQLNDFAPRLFR